MASSNHQAIISDSVNHIFVTRQWPLCACCVTVPSKQKQGREEVCGDQSEGMKKGDVGKNLWLISGDHCRGGQQDSLQPCGTGELYCRCPLNAVVHSSLQQWPHVYIYIYEKRSLLLKTMSMNGLNVNQKNVSLCYPSTRPDELFLSALCIHIQMVSVDMLSSGISCVCAADIKHTYSSTSTFINTHLYTCTQLLSLSTPSIDVQALLLQGLFQALLHSYKGKWTSKCPKNIEFAFISLFRGVQPPERHLIHHKI